jgi:hypothetical protein
MSAMGRILVFINLLFALVTGGFLAVDFATRTNYYEVTKAYERELKVSKANTETLGESLRTEADKRKKLEDLVKDLQKANDQARRQSEQQQLEAGREGEAKGFQVKSGDLTRDLALEEAKRLGKENKELHEVIQKRNEYIVKLNEERNKAQDVMHQALAERDAARVRSETILERLRETEKKLAQAKVTGAGGGGAQPGKAAAPARTAGRPNPPSAYVHGKIDKVFPDDPSLVEMNVGGDDGLAVDQTLDVYRLSPSAQYLGMVRIREVYPHHAIGKVMPSRVDGSRREVRAGDTVASSIQPPR